MAGFFAGPETPSGLVNGVNAIFTLANTPNPPGSLQLMANGLMLESGAGNDYLLSKNQIKFATSVRFGTKLLAWYQY